MYKLFNFVKVNIFNLCLFKTKPENLVYSKFLLIILLALNILIEYYASLVGIKLLLNAKLTQAVPIHPNPVDPNFVKQMLGMISFGFIGIILSVYFGLAIVKKQNRFVQFFSSLLIINLAFKLLITVNIIYINVSLIILIILLFWQLIALIFVFANAFNVHYLIAIILSFVYIYLKYDFFYMLFTRIFLL